MTSRIFPILLIILAIGIFAGYVHPTYTKQVDALALEIKDYDAVLLSARQFKEKQAQLLNEKDAITAEQLARLEAFLPDSVDNVQLILDLNALATRSGILLSELDVSVPVAPLEGSTDPLALEAQGPTDSIQVSVNATGSYAAFHTFLAAVENSLRPLDLVEIDVKDAATGVASGGIHDYEMTFNIYWLR